MKVAILHEGNSKKSNDNGLIKLYAPFDLSHPNFDALKEKLHNLFNK